MNARIRKIMASLSVLGAMMFTSAQGKSVW